MSNPILSVVSPASAVVVSYSINYALTVLFHDEIAQASVGLNGIQVVYQDEPVMAYSLGDAILLASRLMAIGDDGSVVKEVTLLRYGCTNDSSD